MLTEYDDDLKNIILSKIQVILVFTILMVLIRAFILAVLKLDTPYSVRELMDFKFYYGQEKIGVWSYLDSVVQPHLEWLVQLASHNNFFIKAFAYICSLIFGLILIVVYIIMTPTMYLGMKMIGRIDGLNFTNYDPVSWWILVAAIVGCVICIFYSFEMKFSKILLYSLVCSVVLAVFLFIFGGLIIKCFNIKSDDGFNIKKLVDFGISSNTINNTTGNNGTDNTELKTFNEVFDYGKGKTDQFRQILNNNNIENVSCAGGLGAINTNSTYTKYEREFQFRTAYKVQPDFNTGIGEEGFYIYYELHKEDTLDTNHFVVSLIADSINTMAKVEITKEEIVELFNKGEESNSSKSRKFKEADLIIKTTPTSIAAMYKSKFNNYIHQRKEFVVENGILVSPIKTYETVSDYLNNLENRKKEIINRYPQFIFNRNNATYIGEKSDFEVTLYTEKLWNEDKKPQFVEKIRLNFNSKEFNDVNDYDLATVLIDIVRNFTGEELGDVESLKKYLSAVKSDFTFENRISKNDSLFNSLSFKYPDFDNYKIIFDKDSLFILMPVIAEGIYSN